MIGLTRPLLVVWSFEVSGKSLILIVGGLFLLARSTREVHEKLKGDEKKGKRLAAPSPQLRSIQIMLLNVIFSLDSVITAVGMVDQIPVMIAGSSSPSS